MSLVETFRNERLAHTAAVCNVLWYHSSSLSASEDAFIKVMRREIWMNDPVLA